jgi:hypothetical protein
VTLLTTIIESDRVMICLGGVESLRPLASFAVLRELCADVSLLQTTDAFRAKLAKDRKARPGFG